MTWVKICGITNLEDALVAVEAGADAVGFVFYEKSPRCVSVETAREIVGKLPASVEKVGVFVGGTAAAVSEACNRAGLTVAQLYVESSAPSSRLDGEFVERLRCRAIVALRVGQFLGGEADDPDVITGFRVSSRLRDQIVALLLDSGNSEHPGGSGERFEWDEVAIFREDIDRIGLKLVVAGGLTPQNVPVAMRILKPWGVDVASGVEARPGKKDPEKVRAFVRAVREYDRKVS
jgi:phosphoribosylanthranilate isomerase